MSHADLIADELRTKDAEVVEAFMLWKEIFDKDAPKGDRLEAFQLLSISLFTNDQIAEALDFHIENVR